MSNSAGGGGSIGGSSSSSTSSSSAGSTIKNNPPPFSCSSGQGISGTSTPNKTTHLSDLNTGVTTSMSVSSTTSVGTGGMSVNQQQQQHSQQWTVTTGGGIPIRSSSPGGNPMSEGSSGGIVIGMSSSSFIGVPSSSSSVNAPAVAGTPPSAGLKFPINNDSGDDDKKLSSMSHKTSLRVALPKMPSTDSLNNSNPCPASPGLVSWTDSNTKLDLTSAGGGDKTGDASKLNRKESYKAQRKNYRREKKRVASELLNSLQDPAIIVLADWLKVRGTLKSWTKLWCVLKPGLLLLYKSPKTKSSHWVGTILLTSCQVIERPSKKDGFCFKLFHPLEQSIWAPRGPDKETIGAVVQPLPTAYLIFRAPSQAAGKCWMDALELSLRCSSLLLRSNSNSGGATGSGGNNSNLRAMTPDSANPEIVDNSGTMSHETQWSEADYEKHFNDHDLDADSQNEAAVANMSGIDTETESEAGEILDPEVDQEQEEPTETPYVYLPEEEFGGAGEQVEELPEEHKSLIWFLVKQVRPGMDLSKVVLPTFILEPRSFLDKLSDSYYHADMLSKAVAEDDPFTRLKTVVQWYMSGFYKKPKGLKKPYNPILGETFRCYWEHLNGSRTYYIAEQVSHHPPISAFYVTNRQDGFAIACTILARSKFYGNSTSAILDGVATLTLLPRGESYTLTVPYAHCKGILMGTLSMELGGKVTIQCESTGYKAEIEFKLKPFLGNQDSINIVYGRIKLGKETLAILTGYWDREIKIKDCRSGEESILFSVNSDIKQRRLKRYVVPIEHQASNESERLWQHVSAAILRDDQESATEEKTVLEEAQRKDAKERKATLSEWTPQHFQQDLVTGSWLYKYADLRPWDPRNDVKQYEWNYRVLTKTRHQAPMIRTASIISSEPLAIMKGDSRQSLVALKSSKRLLKAKRMAKSPNENVDEIDNNTDSSQSNDDNEQKILSQGHRERCLHMNKKVLRILGNIQDNLDDHTKHLNKLQRSIDSLNYAPVTNKNLGSLSMRDSLKTLKIVGYIAVGVFIAILMKLIFK